MAGKLKNAIFPKEEKRYNQDQDLSDIWTVQVTEEFA